MDMKEKLRKNLVPEDPETIKERLRNMPKTKPCAVDCNCNWPGEYQLYHKAGSLCAMHWVRCCLGCGKRMTKQNRIFKLCGKTYCKTYAKEMKEIGVGHG